MQKTGGIEEDAVGSVLQDSGKRPSVHAGEAVPDTESWRVAELKALQPFLLDKLAQLRNQVNATGSCTGFMKRVIATQVLITGCGKQLAMRPI